MRSLTFPPTNPLNASYYNLPFGLNTAYLGPYYMNVFDALKVDREILGKRQLNLEADSVEKEAQKRLRTSLAPNGFINTSFQQNGQVTTSDLINAPEVLLGGFQCKVEGVKQEDTLSYSQYSLSSSSEQAQGRAENVNVKEEYVKLEESFIKQEASECSNSFINEESSKIVTSEQKDELSLVDLTRIYPDWDLVTIFRHIESDKPPVPAGISERIKMRRKQNKMAEQKVKESKSLCQIPKTMDDDYKPGNSINVKFREADKGKKKTETAREKKAKKI